MERSDQILDICARNGIEVQLVSSRFRFHDCPFCGDTKWKVWLYENDDSVAGKCFKCDKKFSIYILLQKYGLSNEQLREICSKRIVNAEDDTDFSLLALPENIEAVKTEIVDGEWNKMAAWRYWNIEDKPNHPASLYAISRGIKPALYPEVKIDIQNNAVVFLVRDSERNLIGFQSRYVEPKTGNKTYTAFGFKTANSLLRYFNIGDIFVCEGPFNAVTAHNWGHTGLCTFGSKISDYQLKEIRYIAQKLKKKICCAFDEDDAGYHAYLQVKDVCLGYGIEVMRVRPDFGNDLNDSWKNDTGYEVIEEKDLSLYHFLPELKL